jgi:Ice-binding-like
MKFFKLYLYHHTISTSHRSLRISPYPSISYKLIHLYPPSIRSHQISTFAPKNFVIMKCTMFSTCRLALFVLITAQQAIGLAHPAIENRAAPVVMGLAKTFGAIAASTLTSTGDTVITGDCGTCPGTAITGFPPGKCTGTTSAGGTAACNAEAACLTAYNNAKGLAPTEALNSSDLGGLTLAPGVFTFPTSGVTLTGTLTLDGATNPDGQWIFQITTTFMTAVNAKVVLEGGAQACNVYFQVGSSATILAGTKLKGNILAYTSISVGSAASNKGTFCALNGAITLIDDALTAKPTCTT